MPLLEEYYEAQTLTLGQTVSSEIYEISNLVRLHAGSRRFNPRE